LVDECEDLEHNTMILQVKRPKQAYLCDVLKSQSTAHVM